MDWSQEEFRKRFTAVGDMFAAAVVGRYASSNTKEAAAAVGLAFCTTLSDLVDYVAACVKESGDERVRLEAQRALREFGIEPIHPEATETDPLVVSCNHCGGHVATLRLTKGVQIYITGQFVCADAKCGKNGSLTWSNGLQDTTGER